MTFDWTGIFGRSAPRVVDVGCGDGGFVLASMHLGGRWRDAWTRWFGPANAWRTTLALLVGFGLLGGAVNDSGVVIPAVVAVYVGAYVLLLQRRRPWAPPHVTIGPARAPRARRP